MKHRVEFDLELKRHNFPGKFVVFEGVDASGKTTHSLKLVERLKEEGEKVVYTKEPTDGPIGKLIRQALVEKVKIPPTAFQYLFCADRAVHQEEIIAYLKEGYIVVSDRYFWSAVAYGISDLGGVPDFYLTAYSVLSFYNQFITPDLTLFLDVEAEVAAGRIEASRKHREIYDKREKIIKIKESYGKLIHKFPEEFTVINANRSLAEVEEEISSLVGRAIK